MKYDLELERAAREIQEAKAKRVCIQLPDGLKPESQKIADFLEKQTGAEVVIWLSTCFGACDTPSNLDKLGIDLLIQFGHSEWR